MKTIIITLVLSLFTASVYAQSGTASYYGLEVCRGRCETSCGKSLYHLVRDDYSGKHYAASPTLPCGTRILVKKGQKNVLFTVWDRGPAKKLNRIIDLSPGGFLKLGGLENGILKVEVEVLNGT